MHYWQAGSETAVPVGSQAWTDGETFRLVAVSDQKHHVSQDASETTEPVGGGSRQWA